ncbi:MAG: sigma-70 family RNA polymerase sigma factor [Ignavibacterium sp.]|jgi:RNA polymerase sigma-70 factor (ECF subfamily)|uniref:RNA polymerase sigma factor n=1 Tax=Ignavibacterium sp. TaxID=2651167 RepID=UPI00329948E1
MAFELDPNSLTDKIIAGDSEAENHLFLLFKERIEFLVRARLRGKVSSDDQKDVISEARQAILLSLRKGGFDPSKGKPLEAYIAGIVSNVVAMHFRNLSKKNPAEDLDKYHSLKEFNNPLSEILDNEKKKKLNEALNRLDEKYRNVLLMRVYDELSIEEISNHLGIEKRRVSERINYAFKLLLKELKKQKYFQ